MGFFDFLSARRKQHGIQPSAEVTLEHAEERLASGDYTKAEQDYQQLRDALPDEPKAWIGYALAAQRDKRWIDALERWQAAAGRFTDLIEPAAGVARALKELGELDQAEVCYAELTDRFPAQAVGWIEHARIAVHQKRWADARERWQVAAERFPGRLLPAYGFARALELLGDLEQAEAHYAELTNRFPAHAEGWIGYARIAESQKRWADARERWQAAAGRFPDLFEPAAGVAHALKELGELDQAEVCYAELTDRFPAQAVGWIEHARIAVHQKRWADAGERWQAAAERFPERFQPAYGFARALELLGDLEQAEAHYAELTNRFPAHAEGWIGYARIAESQKRWADALERWTVAAERFPQEFVCALGKARALMYAEAYEDARLLLDDISKRFGQPAQIKRVEQLYAQLPS